MATKFEPGSFQTEDLVEQLEEHGHSLLRLKSHMFHKMRVFFNDSAEVGWNLKTSLARNYIEFGGGSVTNEKLGATHVVVAKCDHRSHTTASAGTTNLSRVVGVEWIERCWEESTRVDEERFQWG